MLNRICALLIFKGRMQFSVCLYFERLVSSKGLYINPQRPLPCNTIVCYHDDDGFHLNMQFHNRPFSGLKYYPQCSLIMDIYRSYLLKVRRPIKRSKRPFFWQCRSYYGWLSTCPGACHRNYPNPHFGGG